MLKWPASRNGLAWICRKQVEVNFKGGNDLLDILKFLVALSTYSLKYKECGGFLTKYLMNSLKIMFK